MKRGKKPISFTLILLLLCLVLVQTVSIVEVHAEPVTVAFLSIAKLMGYTALTMGGGYAAYQAYASWAPSNMLTELMSLSGAEWMAVSAALMQSIRDFIVGGNISLTQSVSIYDDSLTVSNVTRPGASTGYFLIGDANTMLSLRVQSGTNAGYVSLGFINTSMTYQGVHTMTMFADTVATINLYNARMDGSTYKFDLSYSLTTGTYQTTTVSITDVQALRDAGILTSVTTGVIGANIPLDSGAWERDENERFLVPGFPGTWRTDPLNPFLDLTPAPDSYVNTPVDQVLENGYSGTGTGDITYPDVGTIPDIDTVGWTAGLQGLANSISAGMQALFTGIISIPGTITTTVTNIFAMPANPAQINLQPLQGIALMSVFPFCIPWDLYNTFAIMAAPPQVPVFEFQILGVALTWDLSPFGFLASIQRWAIYIIFLVGLMVSTRSLIGGKG